MTKKSITLSCLLLPLLLLFTGCSNVGSKSANISVIYIVTATLSLLLLLGYFFLVKKRETWFIVLFSAVMVVNIGYLSLSLSGNLNEALLSNRIAYLGSVFLPVSMLMNILKACKLEIRKGALAVILAVSAVVFIIAASPGYLDVYYKEVSLVTINGVSVLEKVYGPLHSVYLYYLVAHFTTMIAVIIYARIKRKIASSIHAVVLLASVFVNIGVWLMEQLIKFDFEFLSVSYIVSELFLLGICLIIQDNSLRNSLSVSNTKKADSNSLSDKASTPAEADKNASEEIKRQWEYLSANLCTLTPTEKQIYSFYLEGKGTKDIMATLNITENTLKYHNKNIYSKLGVSSRKQLLQIVTVSTATT